MCSGGCGGLLSARRRTSEILEAGWKISKPFRTNASLISVPELIFWHYPVETSAVSPNAGVARQHGGHFRAARP
ncbi:hypothetical protein RSK60_520014 [Ralstonia solanacearum K60]|nr:hypothetical protein RSK60_520014 [Ralstonia solanacearum K60]